MTNVMRRDDDDDKGLDKQARRVPTNTASRPVHNSGVHASGGGMHMYVHTAHTRANCSIRVLFRRRERHVGELRNEEEKERFIYCLVSVKRSDGRSDARGQTWSLSCVSTTSLTPVLRSSPERTNDPSPACRNHRSMI